MTAVGDEFRRRWRSGRHIGIQKPAQLIRVRPGKFTRGYTDWASPAVNAKIPGETAQKPWNATWQGTGPWVDLPPVLSCEIQQSFSAKGVASATLTIENTFMRSAANMGFIYHLLERGALSPTRGYTAPGMPHFPIEVNEWYGKIVKNAQIDVWQGYGEDEMVRVFTGLIDDVDPTSKPDRLNVTCRDFGQVLTEERAFGLVNGTNVNDPVTFAPKPPDKVGDTKGEGVGYDAQASSKRDGYPARLVVDKDAKSGWISQDHGDAEVTEWVEVHLPKGRYESFAIHPRYSGMEMFVGVYARDNLLGGESASIDELNVNNGWMTVPADEGGGTVPGTHGGWPYIKRWARVSDAGVAYRLDHKLELGENSILRVGFRHLKAVGSGNYRAGVNRLAGIRRKSERTVILRQVGEDADASSSRDGHPSKNVLDKDTTTTWISSNRGSTNVTEWVEIHVPQGRYDSITVHIPYDHMEMYIGVFARPRRRKKKKGGYEYYPSQCDDVDIDEGFVALGNGLVPGDENGGWSWVNYFPDVNKTLAHKMEKFSLGHKFEVGPNSVIRLGFRHLNAVGDGHYRASVGKFKALTRTGVKQPEDKDKEKKEKKIIVDDVSDIVKVVLRWAGFKEWAVETTGAKLKGDWTFNRQTFLMDIIDKVAEATGYVFYISSPSEADESIGIPVFRSPMTLRDDIPVEIVRDSDLLTGVQGKLSDESLTQVIRVRGAVNKKEGKVLGGDRTKRLMATYLPPWNKHVRLANVLTHYIHYEARLGDQLSCDVMSRLIGVQQALASAQATAETPGFPFDLDSQVSILDIGTGLQTRIYVGQWSISFQGGKQPSFKSTIGGALLDTEDIVDAKAELRAVLPAGQLQLGDDFIELG